MSDRAVRIFAASHRLTWGALTRVKAVHTGLWLGLLPDSALAALDEATYAGTYAYHTTDAHNSAGLFDWEEAALRHFPPTGRLLVTSAGGGREVLALRRRGYDVAGFECNPALLRDANARLARLAPGPDLLPAARDAVPDLAGPFDGVVLGWASLTYVRTRARRHALLARLRALVASGAPLLASFYARTDDRAMRLAQRLGNLVGRPLGRPRVELGDVIDPVFQHYFSEAEVRSELADAGFAVERHETRPFAHAVARAV